MKKWIERLQRIMPEAAALFAICKSRKAQGSLEYIMMVAAASIVIVMAFAMMIKLKGAVAGNVTVNGANVSISKAISSELGTMAKNVT